MSMEKIDRLIAGLAAEIEVFAGRNRLNIGIRSDTLFDRNRALAEMEGRREVVARMRMQLERMRMQLAERDENIRAFELKRRVLAAATYGAQHQGRDTWNSRRKAKTCEWEQDGDCDSDTFCTGCLNSFAVTDHADIDWLKYCPYCGGAVTVQMIDGC